MQLIKEETIKDQPEEVTLDETFVDIDFLLHKIQQLPDRYRLVFNLYVLDRFSHKEIAEMLNISEGTSKSNLSRARLLLKKMIENHQQQQEKSLNEG